MRSLIQSAERILIPKGDDNEACINALQEAGDIEVPEFPDEVLKVTSNGRTFWKLRGKDIPGFIARGYGDVGGAGTDSRVEYIWAGKNYDKIRYQAMGQAMGRFSVLAWKDKAESALALLSNRTFFLRPVVTSLPNTLIAIASSRDDLPLTPFDIGISGSVEGVMSLLGAEYGADIVERGETARQNGLAEIYKLFDVYPEIIVGANNANL